MVFSAGAKRTQTLTELLNYNQNIYIYIDRTKLINFFFSTTKGMQLFWRPKVIIINNMLIMIKSLSTCYNMMR